MKLRTILLFGAPGSGKGTQGKILGTIPGYYHCACGDVFRNLNADSRLGRVFLEYSSRGELVPDEATVDLWRNNIQANTMLGRFNPERDTVVLDGIPRNAAQAKMLQGTLDVRALLHLTCPDRNKMVERLQRRALRDNRLDDANLDVIRTRLQVYDQETKPVLDFYGPDVVHDINATQTPVEVLSDILRVIAKV
ncbi:MAG: adenylate kinase [Limisphaerales bacterium]|nr:MAG: adenylate kinase [Limisphaerales bacterium]KAG0509274.1 MAG: adenylate kinase [Limisphaerales bacterium]TXT52187.1 MAG: adenylate kinase [Limisphaerales bacterium]